jgi:hypothetical protein
MHTIKVIGVMFHSVETEIILLFLLMLWGTIKMGSYHDFNKYLNDFDLTECIKHV